MRAIALEMIYRGTLELGSFVRTVAAF